MSESAEIRRIRADLAELRDPGPSDPEGHALYTQLGASYEADLQELGAEIDPHDPPRPPIHAVIRLTTPRKPALAERVAEPPQPEVLPALPVEPPMPAKLPPREKLKHLQERLAAAGADGKNPYRHKLQHQIRVLCTAEGWPIPPEAVKATPEVKSAIAKAAHPKHRVKAPAGDPVELRLRPARVLHFSEVAARVRALRSMALDLLPSLEDLADTETAAVEAELGLLAETLTLGGKVLRARVA